MSAAKSALTFWILILLTGPAAFSAQDAPVTAVSSGQAAWGPRWEKAKDLVNQGAYTEAKKIYEELLTDQTLGKSQRSIREEYEDLQVKIILSPVETQESFYHEVVSGDSLWFLAKKYGTTIELLRRSNNLKKDQIRIGQKLKVTKLQFSILVKKRRNYVVLLADGHPLKRYRVATGEKGSTPAGRFKIVNRLENPTWFHAGAVVPPDSPENILGTRWLGFDHPGYGIHGTTLPGTIGTQSSKGCIRMLNKDVEEIYDLLPVGTVVTIEE